MALSASVEEIEAAQAVQKVQEVQAAAAAAKEDLAAVTAAREDWAAGSSGRCWYWKAAQWGTNRPPNHAKHFPTTNRPKPGNLRKPQWQRMTPSLGTRFR